MIIKGLCHCFGEDCPILSARRRFYRNRYVSNGSDGLHRTTFPISSKYCLHFRIHLTTGTRLFFPFYCTTRLHCTPGFVHWNLVESIGHALAYRPTDLSTKKKCSEQKLPPEINCPASSIFFFNSLRPSFSTFYGCCLFVRALID